MSDYSTVKTTIKDHPTETVAAVAAVTIIGLLFLNHSKSKKLKTPKIEYCRCSPPRPFWQTIIMHLLMIQGPKHLPH